ncbi:hypothetical protein MPNT_50063 [Candidatus Methylacidithermus pantelleriae]|uniref:Uncharacterized protein n=1 Tax=Candidatus Methylacidithermus pantelleriae TaxID=2744239 RepID=A0A8J2BNR5_9BACT|nr:hypothetical protein MPNT_50063 [Candidatus Methylacidithermus pantelleriae]
MTSFWGKDQAPGLLLSISAPLVGFAFLMAEVFGFPSWDIPWLRRMGYSSSTPIPETPWK